MTLAQTVADVALRSTATTFDGAYAVMPDGKRVHLPQGVCITEKRNTDGRCTLAKYRYTDDSIVTFRWNPDRVSIIAS